MQLMQTYQAAMAGAQAVDPYGMAQPMMPPPEVLQAQALLQDFAAGMEERQTIDKVGKTLEVLYAYFVGEQKPVDFKTAMKQLVRRVSTTCVGYVELGFQREYAQDETITGRLADVRGQLAHVRALTRGVQTGDDSEAREAQEHELALSTASLQQQEYVLLREGLVFDFPESTRVVPDRRTRNLVGFVGARWLTVEYLYSPDEVLGLFGVDLGGSFTPYSQSGQKADTESPGDDDGSDDKHACVLKHFDRQTGMVYLLCDGYKGFLRPPAAPDVYVEDFWPVYALVFNQGEDSDQLYPLSDVALIRVDWWSTPARRLDPPSRRGRGALPHARDREARGAGARAATAVGGRGRQQHHAVARRTDRRQLDADAGDARARRAVRALSRAR
jgi:hypothetical protein